jgi:hypothetical protein
MISIEQIIILILFYFALNKYYDSPPPSELAKKVAELQQQINQQEREKQEKERQVQVNTLKQVLQERDRDVATDVMAPPERRLPIRNIPPKQVQRKFWKSTQGVPENYQYVGNLVRDSDNKILPIFGREDHPRSDYWEYYIVFNQNDDFGVKIPITKKPIRELEEDDTIDVDYFPGGKFTYKPFEIESIKYNPYDY